MLAGVTFGVSAVLAAPLAELDAVPPPALSAMPLPSPPNDAGSATRVLVQWYGLGAAQAVGTAVADVTYGPVQPYTRAR
jgi:hypothetical protein